MQLFICDSMLGSLARLMRMVGIDTEYWRSHDRRALAEKAARESRVVLTRIRRIPRNLQQQCTWYTVTSETLQDQMNEVVRYFSIQSDTFRPLARCLRCNKELVYVSKAEVAGHIPEYVYNNMNEFSMCLRCKRIYWKGTHYNNMLKLIKVDLK
ncbi:MAG: Mut7-C RNAse domain-containing protein [Desulfobacterota bacterium]|nr:Mut7-C RNAse domain-containing protein [Thermodesulfobacteriota bacterium]